ncbi:hypothetical protein IVA93_31685 [Bradyrhizobium sp. 155]|uniref:hypothetical protein n=1 Tax=Bradyrhizobium sp. 155 TaxID=2782629 RepID=UPI001FFE5A97|nr:hypothetical protein [Bradyrhizobium sp. 155]UPK10719.1 hypothetical protein IVA93_31685 [Bradyrhizobium sp. 155]
MFTASVVRKQYAVGHGGFHAGKITVRKDELHIPELMMLDTKDATGKSTTVLEKFYVYDCGSESPQSFDRSLRNHERMTGGRTDLLFISHLVSDHVNKIDRLMGTTPAKIVVLPYLEPEDLSELLMREVDGGSATASIRDYIRDPGGWWRRHGADIVVFVEPGNGEDQPPGGGVPDKPIDPEGPLPISPASEEGLQARLTLIVNRPRKPPSKGFVPVPYDTPRDVDRELSSGSLLAGCGSHFRLEWRKDASDRWRLGDWILLPYVHPVECETRRAFRRAIMNELGLNSFENETFASALLDKLASNRKGLVTLYNDHFEVGQNAISMSLYSGPGRSLGSQSGSDWLVPAGDTPIGYSMRPSPAAWLETGDSKLKQSARRQPWHSFFNPFSKQICILSLPHHGSSKDFHEEVLNFDGLALAVATTIRDRNRVAGLEDTLSQVQAAGKQYKVVDDRAETEFHFMCARAMQPI